MMTKTKKKIASILVAAAMLCPMCVASVSAANTTDVAALTPVFTHGL